MPIAHLAPTAEQPQLVLEVMPDIREIVQIWRMPFWETQLTVCQPGAVMDVTPPRWRKAVNFLLHVSEGGEEAELITTDNLHASEAYDAHIAKVQQQTKTGHWGIGSAMTVNAHDSIAYLTLGGKNELLVGGAILCMEPQLLHSMQQLFPDGQ